MTKKARLTRDQEMQGYLDALGAIVIAVSFQIDPVRLLADIRALANQAEKAGHGPSAGLLDELARALAVTRLGEAREH